ncbi:MAG: NADH-quinone oxidoreductase subunit N [Nitrospirae bacterium]|nr:NADH-quinone oxidoreductase subunit N [Nitrospirota bacterium]
MNINYSLIAPELIIAFVGSLVLCLDFTFKQTPKWVWSWISIAGLGVAFGATLWVGGPGELMLGKVIVVDSYTAFFRGLFILTAILTLIITDLYKDLPENVKGEYYCLVLYVTVGMMFMAASTDLVTLIVSLELVSILCYVVVGFMRRDTRSVEGSLKYFVLGAVASGIMFYGISILYGLTGTFQFHTLAERIAAIPPENELALLFAVVVILAGFGFKISLVPFHMWTPDSYQGAPTPFTAFLSIAPKAAALAAMLRFFWVSLAGTAEIWQGVLTVLAILTMTVGNLVAITQTDVKRMMAYSSISQAGYIIVGLIAFNEMGQYGTLFYLLAYLFMNMAVFIVVITISNAVGSDQISGYAGLGKRAPFLAATMVVAFLALIGLPPTAGFVAKFLVFTAAFKAGYLSLVIAGLLNSVISVYYYFNVVRHMYLEEPHPTPVMKSPSLYFVGAVSTAVVLLFGIFPYQLIEWCKTWATAVIF